MEEKIIEIADTLGVEVSELWAWLKNGGVQAYQSAKVAELGTIVAFCAIGIAFCVYLLLHALAERKQIIQHVISYGTDWVESLKVSDIKDDANESVMVTLAASTCALGILSVVLLISLPSLIAWIVSPEGMVLRIIANA